jgi:drug/metabolite transporter (DMT)-like permease
VTGAPRWLPIAAAGTTVLLWASAFVGIRAAGESLSPAPLALGRLLIGSVVLGALVAARRETWPSRRDLLPIALCGLLWFGGYNVALNAAEQRVDAGTAALLVNIGPILIAILAGVFLHEGFPRGLVVGSSVAFCGVAVITIPSIDQASAEVWGPLLCVVAAVLYAAGVVIQKPVLARVSALQVTFLACAVGALACLPFAPQLIDEVGQADRSAIGWLVYLGIFPTAIAFTTWAYALARTTAGRLGATSYLVPATSILLAWLLLDEVPPLLAFVGGTLCLVGVAITRRR